MLYVRLQVTHQETEGDDGFEPATVTWNYTVDVATSHSVTNAKFKKWPLTLCRELKKKHLLFVGWWAGDAHVRVVEHVRVLICICSCLCIFSCTYMHMFVHMHMFVYLYAYVRVYAYVLVCICSCITVYAYGRVLLCISSCICICSRIYANVRTVEHVRVLVQVSNNIYHNTVSEKIYEQKANAWRVKKYEKRRGVFYLYLQ